MPHFDSPLRTAEVLRRFFLDLDLDEARARVAERH
jgi:hypothetical protein